MNNEKNRLIPDLRFPEFANAEEWSIKDFGELIKLLADFTANGSFASLKENVTYFSTEEYAVLVRTTDLDKKIFIPARFTDKRGYDFLSKTSLFGNEIVMANVGSIGKVFRVPYFKKPMTLAPNTYVLKFNDFVDEDFIYQLMLRSVFEQKLLSMVGSSTLMAINKSNLRSIKVEIPTLVEQQKIASCLSSLDELITAQKEKLELLNNHKKGLMQNLFPQEGETVPKFRFPEFENDGEWEVKKLGEIAELTSSKRVHLSDYVSKGIPFYRGKEISQLKSNTIINDILFISVQQYKSIKEKYGVPKIGDILITAVGTLGNVLCIKNNDPFYFKDGNLIWLKNIRVDSIFLEVLLEVEKDKVLASAIGSSQKALTMAALNKLIFKIPTEVNEQQKIASCVASLDDLILAQTDKIEKLQLHKKGLMQGLFPKIID